MKKGLFYTLKGYSPKTVAEYGTGWGIAYIHIPDGHKVIEGFKTYKKANPLAEGETLCDRANEFFGGLGVAEQITKVSAEIIPNGQTRAAYDNETKSWYKVSGETLYTVIGFDTFSNPEINNHIKITDFCKDIIDKINRYANE